MSRTKLWSLSMLATLVAALAPAAPANAGYFCYDQPITDEETTTVMMQADCFSPSVARVQAGGEVTFVNGDSSYEGHVIGGVGGTWGDPHGKPVRKQVTFRFDEEGVYPYFCSTHIGMIGAIVVGDGLGKTAQKGTSSGSVVAVNDFEPPVGGAGKDAAPADGLVRIDPSNSVQTSTGFPLQLVIALVVATAALFYALGTLRRRQARRAAAAAKAELV